MRYSGAYGSLGAAAYFGKISREVLLTRYYIFVSIIDL